MFAKIVVFAIALVLAVYNCVAVDALSCNAGYSCTGSSNATLNTNMMVPMTNSSWTTCIGMYADCGNTVTSGNFIGAALCSMCTGGKLNIFSGDDGSSIQSSSMQIYAALGITVTTW